MICQSCLGTGCEKCNREGFLETPGKPEQHITEKGTELFEAYVTLKQYNIWPDVGGLYDQSANFVHVVRFCDRIESGIHRVKELLNKRNQEIIKKRMRGKSGGLNGKSRRDRIAPVSGSSY